MFRVYDVTVETDEGLEVSFRINEVQAAEIIWAQPGSTFVLNEKHSISVTGNDYSLSRMENGELHVHCLPQRQTYRALVEMLRQASETRRRALSVRAPKSQWRGPQQK